MPPALNNIRVVDFGHYIAGPLTAMLMADYGADVIHIDRPASSAWQNPSDAYYNRGKSRITLDLKSPKDLDVARRLISQADVVIENFRPGVMNRLGLGRSASTVTNPKLIYCSLPGFPENDPRAGVAAWEGVIQAATSGYRPLAAHYYTEYENIKVGDPSRPLFTPIPLASNLAAMTAATSIVMALIARERTGRGQAVEVPLSEAMIEPLSMYIERPSFGGPPAGSTVGKYKCADGRFIDWTGGPPRFVAWLVEAVGLGEQWRAEGLFDFAKAVVDPAHWRLLCTRFRELLSSKSAAEWERIGTELNIPLVLVRSPEEWLKSPHALESESTVSLEDPILGTTVMAGLTVNLSECPGLAKVRKSLDSDRARIFAETERMTLPQKQARAPTALIPPLQGMSVVDLTTQVAGPTAARILREFGADVVKINHPTMLPLTKYINVGKRTIFLNVATPQGKDVLWRLIERADVVSQNFAMGWAELNGFGWEQVHAKCPGVVYSSVSLFSYSGPWGPRRGYEMEGQAGTGLAYRYGGAAGWPFNQPLLLNDTGTGILAAFAIGLGLYQRYHTGRGQHVNASLSQSATLHQGAYLLSYRGKSWSEPAGVDTHGWSALQRMYQASDRWLFVGAREDQTDFLKQILSVQETASSDLSDNGSLGQALAKAFLRDTAANWEKKLNAAGIGAHSILTQPEVEAIPIYAERGLIEFTRLPSGAVEKKPGVGAWLPETPRVRSVPEKPFGSEAEEVLREIGLGSRVSQLEMAGIVKRVA